MTETTATATTTSSTALQVDEWNERHEVGAVVHYWPGSRGAAPRVSRTRSEAWMLGDHTPVVMVEGYAGGIALTHVEVLDGPELLVALHALAVEADHNAAVHTDRTAIEASLAAHREHDAACEAYRRKHHPRAHRLVAVFGEVFTVSRTGRSIRTVYPEVSRG